MTSPGLVVFAIASPAYTLSPVLTDSVICKKRREPRNYDIYLPQKCEVKKHLIMPYIIFKEGFLVHGCDGLERDSNRSEDFKKGQRFDSQKIR